MITEIKKELVTTDKNVAIVIGGYVNGLHAIRALGIANIPIIAIDFKDNIGLQSKYITQKLIFDYETDEEVLLNLLITIGEQLSKKGVLVPTHDHHTKLFAENYEQLDKYYHVPVNKDTLLKIISKEYQYNVCEEIGIPYPKSVFVRSHQDVERVLHQAKDFLFPVVLKPLTRAENSSLGGLFRIKTLETYQELCELEKFISDNIEIGFLVSEVVPGEPDNIWAFTGYCNRLSKVLTGWTGRKLTQRPYYYGVFSTARSQENEIVKQQGIALLEAFKHIGIGEPEFKYDARDGKYKLMETNPRLMMWHGLGLHAGVNLPLVQYYDMVGEKNEVEKLLNVQYKEERHLVFMDHELRNILDHKPRSKYIKNAIKSLFLPRKIWGIWSIKDPKPWICYVKVFARSLLHKIFSRGCKQ